MMELKKGSYTLRACGDAVTLRRNACILARRYSNGIVHGESVSPLQRWRNAFRAKDIIKIIWS